MNETQINLHNLSRFNDNSANKRLGLTTKRALHMLICVLVFSDMKLLLTFIFLRSTGDADGLERVIGVSRNNQIVCVCVYIEKSNNEIVCVYIESRNNEIVCVFI